LVTLQVSIIHHDRSTLAITKHCHTFWICRPFAYRFGFCRISK
jgi:hypothetical protein